MNHQDKTKEELIIELQELQQENNSLKALYDKDITERKRVEKELAQQNDALSKLNHFSINLSMLSSEDNLEALISKFIKEFTGSKLSIFFEYDPETRTLSPKHIELEQGHREKVVNVLGKQVYNIQTVVNDEMYRKMTNEIIGIHRTLYDTTFGAISRPLGAIIKTLLKVDRFIGLAYFIEGRLYGTSFLAMSKGQPDPPKQILNNFISLVSVSLRRKQAENALRESELKFRSVSEMAPVAVFIFGQDSFEYANPESLKMSGYTEEEMAKMKFWEIIHPDDLQMVKDRGFSRLNGDLIPSKYETKILTKDGQIIWIIFSGKLIDYQNKPAILGIAIDITERKHFEEEIKLKNKELHLLIAEKDKFFSIIAHDLRSPFQTFLGFTKIMAGELPTLTLDEIQKIAVTMRNSANKLFNLLENLLEWSQMQRGIFNYNPESLVLSIMIAASIELVRNASDKKMIGISSDIPEDLTVMADPQMFESLMRNLVFNAVKFTPKGGKVIIAAKPMAGNSVEISISDTGIGMSKYILDSLFHLDMAPSRKGTEGESSTGLGLLLCKDFVHKHGGKIWAESEEGKGSVFYFTISCNPGFDTQNGLIA